MDHDIVNTWRLPPQALLDLAGAGVSLVEARSRVERRASGTRRGPRRCAGTGARAARAGDLATIRSTRSRRRRLRASDGSVIGSRCVWTASTGTAARIAARRARRPRARPRAASSPGSLRCSESSFRPSNSTRGRCGSRAPGHGRGRRVRAVADVAPRAARRGRRRRCPAARRSRAASTASAAAWPWPTPAEDGTPITTSANWRPPPGASAAGEARPPARARRSPHAPQPRRPAARDPSARRRCTRISRAAAARTSTATKSAAIESPFGYPARTSRSPTSTASEPARSVPKWTAFDASAALRALRRPARRRRHATCRSRSRPRS